MRRSSTSVRAAPCGNESNSDGVRILAGFGLGQTSETVAEPLLPEDFEGMSIGNRAWMPASAGYPTAGARLIPGRMSAARGKI
jgi:hypothetical protein